MIFDPSNMEHRRVLAEQLLRSLVTGLERLAREQGYLQHCVNLQFSIASNHVRVLDNHDGATSDGLQTVAPEKASPSSAGSAGTDTTR